MVNSIIKMNNGYGLDSWGNYLKLEVTKNENLNEWQFSYIEIIRDEKEKEEAKRHLSF